MTQTTQPQGILGSGLRDGLQLKPVRYQWAMDLYNQAVANTWFPNEVQLVQDLAAFEKLTDDEKHALKTVISYLNPNELLINKSFPFLFLAAIFERKKLARPSGSALRNLFAYLSILLNTIHIASVYQA
jgi:ribonucleotide reductase beta subunit family protein with ferritin-like domain